MIDIPQALACSDEQRRTEVRANPALNGIDFVEVDAATHRFVHVHFIHPLPLNAYDIPTNVQLVVSIDGGVRVVGIRALSATRRADGTLDIEVDHAGDFSTYLLTIDVPQLDPRLRQVALSFTATCPVDFDCRAQQVCPAPVLVEPLLDYMAKDYSSFRGLLLDLLPRLNPRFVERNPADLGIALVELFAYHGDHLSYFQDAVAAEAYLDTARQRISARRHGRLIDYRVSDGRNAWTWVHVTVDGIGTLSQGSKVLSRIATPLVRTSAPPGVVLDESEAFVTTPVPVPVTDSAAGLVGAVRSARGMLRRDPALASVEVFETALPQRLDPLNNEIRLHTWGDEECCMRIGATEAHLYSVAPASGVAHRPPLQQGDHLLLEEVLGPATGVPGDADPRHRQVVRISQPPEETEDPLFAATLIGGALQIRGTGDPALPLLRVRWSRDDGVQFPVCITTRSSETGLLRDVSVARGNMILADHGTTLEETIELPEPVPPDEPFRLPLSFGPLTQQCMPTRPEYDAQAHLLSERHDLRCALADVQPALALVSTFVIGNEVWTAVPDLLDSPPFARQFVAEVADDDGRAVLRFGDGEYGREVAGATQMLAVYRVGNGSAGNVGAGALSHLALAAPANFIRAVRNPLPAQAGTDAETVEQVRQRAPQAFRATQFRAVTESDYVAAAVTLPPVEAAAARFRWTGSWYTVFVAVKPRDRLNLVVRADGRRVLAPSFESRVRAGLTRYRLAGYDLEIRPPTFVALELKIDVCVGSWYFRADVAHAVLEALGTGVLADGRLAFFHPHRFTFGQPVFLSQLYAAIEHVEGVDSAVVKTFRRYGQVDNGELAAGVLPIGPWEIAQLENDPNFMEHGALHINALGGK